MTEVNREVIHQPLHIRALTVPFRQAVDRKGVPQVVQPWLVASPVGASHADVLAQPLEGPVQGPRMNRLPVPPDEEAAGVGRWVGRRSPADIIVQHLGQVPADGNQTRLEELAVPDGEQPVWYAYVRDRQTEHLATAQAGPVHQEQQGSQRGWLQVAEAVIAGRDRVQETAKLLAGVNVGD